ncbi:MAG: (d)CMP kinase [Planctomycetaceae bacterium]|jgi:CMP/dCMP kinase|nr:(d)CMP kinase [Planctomycetaceae bacterium]MBT6155925.1 (d)CMP kinase [Planctomycetaceae bacterium]MBT6483160.1 (d)CMP kinase [Planctomycetaceae bacterium]MBT6497762.1 (d)CMP kinase [Planctomycetaceae bacterium]
MIVTIDGPAGSGKSTAAKGLAARLGFRFLDTGALYRVTAYECLRAGVEANDETAAVRIAEALDVRFDGDRVYSAGIDVTTEIRTPEVTEIASVVARYADVRQAMDRRQREFAVGQNIVTEGRDQGTVVFPDAQCKFFLVADAEERASRRKLEMESQGQSIALDELTVQIEDRDRRDADRSVAPLKAADDAINVETSRLNADEVIDLLERTVRERLIDNSG